jgi:hypothetical protein
MDMDVISCFDNGERYNHPLVTAEALIDQAFP